MSIRAIPKMVQCVGNTTVSYSSSPAGTIRSGCSISSGLVIDRTKIGRGYNAAVPFAIGHGNQSTQANAKVTIGVRLFHGDSSGGGDLAVYSTGSEVSDAVFLTSAMTTSYTNWTTGDKHVQSNPPVYDMRGAKRYVTAVVTPTINHNATSTTAAGALLNISGGIAFMQADEEPFAAGTKGDYSTSTST